MKLSTIKKTILVLIFWIAVWQIASMAVGREIILPSPYRTLESLVALMQTEAFYRDAATTILRCIIGIAFSFVFGFITATLSYRFSAVRSLMSFPVLVFKATPVMAIILILLLSFRTSNVPIVVCFLMCFPVVYTNLLTGFDNMSREHIELSKFYRLNTMDMVRFIYIPSVMPQISASLNLIAGLSWKTVVAAEVLAAPQISMGYNLFLSKVFLQVPNLFAWVIAIVCLSLIFEKIIKLAVKQFLPKPYSKSKIVRGVQLTSWQETKSGLESELKPNFDSESKLKPNLKFETEARVGSDFESESEPESESQRAPEIKVLGLSKNFGDKVVFSNFSESFPPAQTTAIMAPSGYGKTTLLRIIAGLEKKDGGEILGASGEPLSYLFQEDRLLPWLNVFDNIALFLKNKLPKAEIQEQTNKILEMLELSQNKNQLPKELSGGMKHRVAIGRALVYPASVLLLDEPFKGLDDELKNRTIPKLQNEYMKNKTVILVTHNKKDADRLSDNVIDLQRIESRIADKVETEKQD